MKYVIRREYDLDTIQVLRRDTLPGDRLLTKKELASSAWWTARDKSGAAVGYGGMCESGTGAAFLISFGVVEGHRGHGLQRRLIRVCTQHAKRLDYHAATTYVAPFNFHSSRSFVREGFEPYCFDDGFIYYRKDLA